MSTPPHFRLARKAFKPVESGGCPFWNKKRIFSEWEAWEYLIKEAAYAPYTRTLRRAGVVDLQRGETPPLAIRFLMRAWGWGSKKRVAAFLDLLKNMDRIRTVKSTPDGDTYFLVNYEFYHGGGDACGDSSGDSSGDKQEENKENKLIPTSGAKSDAAPEGKPQDPPAKKPKRKPAPRAHRLPADWEPTAEHAAYCEAEDIDIDAEATKFRLHAEATGRKQQKWNAAFSTWLRSEIPKARRGSRRPGRPEYITRTG